MFHSIKSKIVIFTLLPLIAILVSIGLLAIINKQQSEKDLVTNRLNTYRTLLESGDLSLESLKNADKLAELLNERVEHAVILKKDGEVLYTTNTTPPQERNDILQATIDEAFTGTETTTSIDEEGKNLLIYISPIIVDEKIVAVLRIDLANEQTKERIFNFILFISLIVLGGILLCYFLITMLLTSSIVNNIAVLKEAALLIEQGDLTTPVERTSNDEIGELAETLEQMRKEVKQSRSSLESANKDLEKLVHDRTSQLETKLVELERLNGFMIDREVKMIALKREVELLRMQNK